MRWIRQTLFGLCSVVLSCAAGCSSEDGQSAPSGQSADGAAFEAGSDDASPDAVMAEDARQQDVASGQDVSADGETEEAGPGTDGGQPDAPQEAAADSALGEAAACVPLDGLGTVVCACNELDDAEWNSSTPFLMTETVDLGTTGWDATQLTPGGQKIVADGNLGGSSVDSEALAYDVLARCEFATLLKSEGEIDYTDAGGKKTDELVSIDSRKVGVSVTRAYHYPPTDPCTVAEAQTLLAKKLGDIPLSAANAVPADAWERSMLGVVAATQQCADVYISVWDQLDATLKGDTIVYVVVTDGDDSAIY